MRRTKRKKITSLCEGRLATNRTAQAGRRGSKLQSPRKKWTRPRS